MPEEPDSARSSVIKSLSDSQMVQPPMKSQSCRGLFIEEMSTTEAHAGEKMWVLLANSVDDDVTILFTFDGEEREAEGVLQREKLLIFTVPYFDPETDVEVFLSLRSTGNRTISIPFMYKVSSDSSVSSLASIDSSHLFAFAESGDSLVLVRPFVEHFPKQDNEGNTILHIAARNQQSYPMKIFLSSLDIEDAEKKKAFINHRNSRGQTALHCAIRSGDADSVHYLVAHGAAVNISDNHKNTALHYLGDAYNEAIFKDVIEPPSVDISKDLEEKNDEGLTPLHIAVKRLKLTLIEMLLEVGSQIDGVDDNGRTSLMHAILMNDPEIVQFFIQKGSDVNHEDKEGETPLLLTKQISNYYMMGALIDAGADANRKNAKGVALVDSQEENVQNVINGERIAPDLKHNGPHVDGQSRPALFGKNDRTEEELDDEEEEQLRDTVIAVEELPGSSRTLDSVRDAGPIRIPISTSFEESDQEEGETNQQAAREHPEGSEPGPSTSTSTTHQRRARKSRFETSSFVKDDISSLDYLTRLRLSKLLDEDHKWHNLAQELNCGHMIELIQICADDNSSPMMIFLDQYEQLPGAKITFLRDALHALNETESVNLIDNRMVI